MWCGAKNKDLVGFDKKVGRWGTPVGTLSAGREFSDYNNNMHAFPSHICTHVRIPNPWSQACILTLERGEAPKRGVPCEYLSYVWAWLSSHFIIEPGAREGKTPPLDTEWTFFGRHYCETVLCAVFFLDQRDGRSGEAEQCNDWYI